MGLGSGRRAMKSPPLLLAVLLACVFVLGINYWITSTRCVELQSRVMELEGRIRRAAAERGAVEMKKNEYEDMLAKQKKQIDTIQSLHSSQLQNVQLLCKTEKESLQSNVTAKDYFLQTLQAEIVEVQKLLEDSKLELKELQENQAKKSTYELAQCSNKIAEVNEQCEEKIRRLTGRNMKLKNEDEEKDTIKFEKVVTAKQDINLKAIDSKEELKYKTVLPTAERPSENAIKERASPRENKGAFTFSLLNIPNHKRATSYGVKTKRQSPPENRLLQQEQTKKVNVLDEKKGPSPQQNKLEDDKDEKEEEVGSDVNPNLPNDEEDDEPKVEDVEDPNKETENEEVERENLINMDGPPEDEKAAKQSQQDAEKLNDYNGDDANEAESETDKQVELRANDQSIRGVKSGNELNKLEDKQKADEDDNRRLK
ncbi:Golgi membrane protein 1 isoform X1 [Ranitomeya variabilis]|uniref:Golgi membrane protein 1 isoform X1 n=1 Tax=Ranitomeya variabilis TaxID=490064 RepID=UPI004057B5E2